ncbi:MAG: peptide chain release factor N(5)-glutamine methyltransferase [Hyphomicrobiaceae bacterium]|nr:peptide chain release factor N(5)-glutamine methyltransferase [Hyphomicrobiaceae bacterium]
MTGSAATAPVNVRQAIANATGALVQAGIEGAADDARRLMAHALGCDRAQLIANASRPLTPAERQRFEASIARRLAREPVSRIEGHRAFYGREFIVTPDVLDPRSDSETVVDTVLAKVRPQWPTSSPPHILDIGTGSGCLLLSVLAEWPGSTGVGLDLSAAALEVSRRNAISLGLDQQASFEVVDFRDGLPSGFDVWVSNPPYIPTNELSSLDREVRDFDPTVALDGGADGLSAYRAILSQAAKLREAPVWIVFEVGAGQASDLVGLAKTTLASRVSGADTVKDLGGHTRCVALKLHTTVI